MNIVGHKRNIAQMVYDSLGRQDYLTDALNQLIDFDYDVKDNMTQVIAAYTCTAFGELATKTQTVAGQSFVVTYSYDDNGLLDSLQYPSGLVVDYTYTGNQISAINLNAKTLLNNVSYDPFGPVTGWSWGNGNPVLKTYDLGGFPSSYSLKSKTHAIDYDDRAQITALKEASTSTTIQSFDYDALYRITNYNGLGETRTFAYDPNGNRTAESLNSNNFTSTIFPSSNRLQSTTGPQAKTFSYDNAGNTTNDGINTYTYDVRNRLRSVNNNSKGYLINVLGQRVMKHDTLNAGDANNDGQITLEDVPITADHIVQKSTALGNPDCTNDSKVTVHDIVCINNQLTSPPTATNQVRFVYDETGHLIGEYDKDGNVIKEYVWLQNIPVAVRQSNNNYYIYTVHLTTPREIANTTGTVIWRWESDPFGIAQPDEDPDNNAQAFTFNLRFPGQYYDLETGLHYNYFRDYDPVIGRYITSDPIGLVGGLNIYTFVSNRPFSLYDYFGLFEILVNDTGGRAGNVYGGTITVTSDSGESVTVPGSSWPNPNNANLGVATGEYDAIFKDLGHRGREPGIRIRDGLPVPTIGLNPNNDLKNFATGINIHCGFSPTNRGSAGCITIQPDRCKYVWDILKSGETGTVKIVR